MISGAHRRRLNRALHELRRPLQALVLLERDAGPVERKGWADDGHGRAAARCGLVELAASALAELDREINGGGPAGARRRFRCRELVMASLERWRPVASPDAIRLYWDAGPAPVEGDPAQMARALDNLIANAIEHGGPPVVVTGAEIAGRVRITVANGPAGPARRAPESGPSRPRRRSPEPRRGHGASVVTEIAAAHGGRFALCRTGSGCVAALELPLADAAALAGAA